MARFSAWLAYFEMYGLRDAQGLLEDEWHDNDRTSDCDIDPSFPLEPPTWLAPLSRCVHDLTERTA